MNKTTILLADDHEIVLDGIEAMLSGDDSLQIIGRENDGVGVLERLGKKPKPDLLILDINMPNKDGIEVSYEAKKLYPEVKILILSMHNRNEFVRKLMDAGADGYILKKLRQKRTAQSH
jgi:DNA-binding NarL/FixJ family response regulator